jgi:dethiobiotin synthetase
LNAGLFVTGTDTGVGKTTVARGLARLARRQGLRPIPFKPVETGCAPGPEDARQLWEAAGRPVPLAEVCPHALPLPAAPAAAAAAAGVRIDLDDLARRARAIAEAGDLLLAEGAGGLLVPYAGSETAADLIARLALPVLIVARTALGTVNHTALTVRELERRRLPVAGIVMVRGTVEAGPHEAGNADLIEAAVSMRPLGVLPYLSSAELADADRIADRLEVALGGAAVRALLWPAARPS